MKKILIIAAHPDDEVLGCGGTITKYAQRGDEVFCLFLGRGKSSRFGPNASEPVEREQNNLEKEAREAAKILGISEIFFESFPDQKYDTVAFLDIVKSVEKIKERIKPEIIFTHHQGDLNFDHQITFKAVLTACRPLKTETVRKIYSFEVPSSTEWGSPKRKDYFRPNVFIDISRSFDKKTRALEAYKSEIHEFPHPRSLKSLEIIARYWGTVAGKELAEPFELIREIK